MNTAGSSSGGRPLLRAAHIPNLICVARILLVWPIVLALSGGNYPLALLLIALAAASDGLDGYLAKRFDWRSRLGGLLDPLADKLLLVSTFVALTLTGLVPGWLTLVVIARDLVIVAGSLAYQAFVATLQPEPSAASKLNTAAQLLFVIGVVANAGFGWPAQEILLVAGATVLVTSVVSGLDYVVRWSARARHAGR